MPFIPNVFIDITEHIEIKRQVLEAYSEEMRQPPHTRSIENAIRQNALRGNSVGGGFSEAYMLMRFLC
jgi:LmbE family N-acetylglucosaminyl deacetylase